MSLPLLKHGFKLYHAKKSIREGKPPAEKGPSTPLKADPPQNKSKMIYHLYNPGNDSNMTPLQQLTTLLPSETELLGQRTGRLFLHIWMWRSLKTIRDS